ncbi:hypothetical protein ASD54_25375 [Rhizobium sp. Root149]|uniref:hypothetical protein n=1 Tax=Rhizobium sp. Root149 TaxID=1736473 RepID=UPI000712C0E0|nr:hypothetical protein [Rhizobium sp. Root149]KQZ56276.1 hypothetical protein ASD54_25375 [Rhizobium sp. Root149]
MFVRLIIVSAMACCMGSATKAGEKIRDWKETYCVDKYTAAGTLTACLLQEAYAEARFKEMEAKTSRDEHRNRRSNCTHFVTGGRGLGSQEYVPQYLQLQCMLSSQAETVFRNCVKTITGKPIQDNTIHWLSYEADKIAACANRQYHVDAKLPRSFQVSDTLLEDISKVPPPAKLPAPIEMTFTEAPVASTCADRAQTYQNRYERHGRVEDLVCLKKALTRELR